MSIEVDSPPADGGKIGTFSGDDFFEQMLVDAGAAPKQVVEELFGIGDVINEAEDGFPDDPADVSKPIDKIPQTAAPAPKTEASPEGEPETPEQDVDTIQQEQIAVLLATMEEQARATLGLAPPVAPEAPVQMEPVAAQPQSAPQDAFSNLHVPITQEDYDAALESAEGFQKVVQRAVSSAVRSMMPAIVNISMETNAALQMEQMFFQSHPYMKDYPGLARQAIQQSMTELRQTEPTFTMEHVIAKAGEKVGNIATLRKALKDSKQITVRDKNGTQFAPGKGGARPARSAVPGQTRPMNTHDAFSLLSKGRGDDMMNKAISEFS